MKKIRHILQIIWNHISLYYCSLSRSSSNRLFSDFNAKISSKQDGLILCEGLWDHPYHWLRLSLFRQALSPIYGSGLIGVYHELSSRHVINSLRSLHPDTEEVVPSKIDKKYYTLADQKLSKVKTSSDIMSLHIAPDYPTHFFYDGVLKRELVGHVDTDLTSVRDHLARTLFYIDFYQEIFERHDIRVTVVSHPTTIRFSTLVWASISNNVPVFVLNYRNEHITIRKLKNFDDIKFVPEDVPTVSDLNLLTAEQRQKLIKAGGSFISGLREGSKGEISVTKAYKTNSKKKFDSRMLAQLVGADQSKQNVVVLASCWPDFPNAQGKSYFNDHVEWLELTLKAAKLNDQYNWIFKPHPAEYMYGDKTTLNGLLKEEFGNGIYLWPEDFPAKELSNCAGCVVTALGSIGYEYPALGARSLVSRDTAYTGWGFSNYATCKEDYLTMLAGACELPLPTKKMQEDALIYIALRLTTPPITQENGYRYPFGRLSYRLWPRMPEFIVHNSENFDKEIRFMKCWLKSGTISYNVFKWLNFDLWK